MKGDGIGDRHVALEHAGGAIRGADADASLGDLGGIEIPLGVEGEVIGPDDVAAHRADRLDRAGLYIDGTDLAAAHLRDVDTPVGARSKAVGAEQSAGLREPLQAPSTCELERLWGSVATAF